MDSPRIRPGRGPGNVARSPRAWFWVFALAAALGFTPAFATAPAARDSNESPTPAARIVSLAPNLTEILLRLGAADRLVGRSSACREPAAQVRDIPVVGDFGVPNLEMLARLHPDAVVTTALSEPGLKAKLEQMGLRVLVIPTRRMGDIPHAIRFLGALAARGAGAEAAARAMEAQIEAARRAAPRHSPAVYMEIWGDPLTTAGADSFLTDMIELAGGRSIFSETPGDYFTVSPEAVVTRDPSVIIFLDSMKPADALAIVKTRPGWNHLRAVREGRVRVLEKPDCVQQPGWNVIQGVEQLRACLKDAERGAP